MDKRSKFKFAEMDLRSEGETLGHRREKNTFSIYHPHPLTTYTRKDQKEIFFSKFYQFAY